MTGPLREMSLEIWLWVRSLFSLSSSINKDKLPAFSFHAVSLCVVRLEFVACSEWVRLCRCTTGLGSHCDKWAWKIPGNEEGRFERRKTRDGDRAWMRTDQNMHEWNWSWWWKASGCRWKVMDGPRFQSDLWGAGDRGRDLNDHLVIQKNGVLNTDGTKTVPRWLQVERKSKKSRSSG